MTKAAQHVESQSTPLADGFSMPARFDRHERTLLTWPPVEEKVGTDLSGFRIEVEATVRAIARFEPVTLLVDPRDATEASERLGDVVELFEIPVDACWIRDNGPIFVRNPLGEVAGVHFGFNGWGGRFDCPKTREMPGRLIEHLGLRRYHTPFICEGGGISVDGEGTLITTEQVMLNDNRYAGITREEVEQKLNEYLGIEKVIWLELGLVEDTATDGHVDNVVKFVAPGVVLAQVVADRSNPNYILLKDNLVRLQHARDAKGRSLDVIEMPVLPYRRLGENDYVIPYTNAYVCNGGIVAPEVDPKLDEVGWNKLQEVYPSREIVPVPSIWQAVGGGGIGCITQQVPRGAAAR